MLKDESQKFSPQFCFAAGVLTATPTAAIIDLGASPEYNAVSFLIITGVGGITFSSTNYINWQLSAGDNSDGSDAAAVVAADVRCQKSGWALGASGSLYDITSAHATPDILKVAYVGIHRYLQLVPTFGGTHGTGTLVAALALLGRPLRGPVV